MTQTYTDAPFSHGDYKEFLDGGIGSAPKQKSANGKQYAHFFRGAKFDETATKKSGRPVYKDAVFVRILTPGDQFNIPIDCMDRWEVNEADPETMMNDHHPHNPKNRFPEAWARFLATGRSEIAGTPIDMLPGITPAQAEMLKGRNVLTIELLADMSDSVMMGGASLKNAAQDYLARAAGAANDAKLRAELEARDSAIAEMRREIEALKSAKPTEPVSSAETAPAPEPVAAPKVALKTDSTKSTPTTKFK